MKFVKSAYQKRIDLKVQRSKNFQNNQNFAEISISTWPNMKLKFQKMKNHYQSMKCTLKKEEPGNNYQILFSLLMQYLGPVVRINYVIIYLIDKCL